MTTFADVLQQLEALSARTITLDDLPIGDLRKKLFDNGEPLDLSILGLAGQVIDSGQSPFKVRWGAAVVTFTAADTSAQVTIPHGMVTVPARAFAMPATPASVRCYVQETAAADATNIYLKAFTTAAAVVTTTQNIYWLALG